jgi:deazaflavin-dependent oxidoreductase (nitroreductase family)
MPKSQSTASLPRSTLFYQRNFIFSHAIGQLPRFGAAVVLDIHKAIASKRHDHYLIGSGEHFLFDKSLLSRRSSTRRSSMTASFLKRVVRIVTNLHIGLYRMSSGKLANRVANLPLLLITTYGRKSRKPRTNPIVYIQEGQNYLVAASTGGMDWHPDWYLNLRQTPQAKIEIGSKVFDVHAEFTTGEERTRLYEKFKAASNNFVKYEARTNRVIPVVRLSPIESGGTGI